MAYTKQTFVFNQILTSAQMNQVESNIEDSRLATGTRAVFNQTSAPNFWTKVTDSAVNENALRVVTGTAGSGGTVDFLNTFGASSTVDATTLSISQMPSHNHTIGDFVQTSDGTEVEKLQASPANNSSGSRGGSGSHTHGMPELKYQDVILAQKD